MSPKGTFACLFAALVLLVAAVLVLLGHRPPESRVPPLEKALALVVLGLGAWLLPALVGAYRAVNW